MTAFESMGITPGKSGMPLVHPPAPFHAALARSDRGMKSGSRHQG